MSLRRSLLDVAGRLLRATTAGPSSSAPPALAAALPPAARRYSTSSAAATDESLDEIRARIFGTAIGDGQPSGRKLLRKRLAGPAVASWYPPDIVDPLFVDVDDTRRKAKLERLRRRGKVAPKKGEGRRAGKKK